MSVLTPRFHRISVGSNQLLAFRTKPRLLPWFSDCGSRVRKSNGLPAENPDMGLLSIVVFPHDKVELNDDMCLAGIDKLAKRLEFPPG